MSEFGEVVERQACPYCDCVVDDNNSNWDEDEKKMVCSQCQKEYTVKAVYEFVGFRIEKQCQNCGDWSDEGFVLCDCEDIGKECVICHKKVGKKDEINVHYMYEDEDIYCMPCAEVEGDTGEVY